MFSHERQSKEAARENDRPPRPEADGLVVGTEIAAAADEQISVSRHLLEKAGNHTEDPEAASMAQRHEDEVRDLEASSLIRLESMRLGGPLPKLPDPKEIENPTVGPAASGETKTEQASAAPPEKAEKIFDPKTHEGQLRQKIKDFVDHPDVVELFSSLHPDDLAGFKAILMQNSGGNERVAKLIYDESKRKGPLAKGQERRDHAALRALFQDFDKKFNKNIDAAFSPRDVLGDVELEAEAIMRRVTGLIDAQRFSGRSPVIDLESDIIRRARMRLLEQMKAEKEAEAEKAKKAEVPVVEKQEQEQEVPQEWLDQKREKAYEDVLEMFASIETQSGPEGTRQWVMDFFNEGLVEIGREALTMEDLESLHCIGWKSDSASEVAGKDVTRPVLLFTDFGAYQRFSVRLRGEAGMASRGMNLPLHSLPEGEPLRETGLLFAVNDRGLIDHEVQHSIDPNLYERDGYDRILAETYAYFQAEIIEDDGQGADSWKSLAGSIGGDAYYESYTSNSERKLSKPEFHALTDAVASAVRAIMERDGDLKLRRALVQMKTLDELFAAAGLESPIAQKSS